MWRSLSITTTADTRFHYTAFFRAHAELWQLGYTKIAVRQPLARRAVGGRGALAHGVEVDHLRQAQAARDGVGQVLCVPLPGEGEICGGRHGHSPLMRTCSALPHWSVPRSEEHTSALQSLMRISYAVFCLKKNKSNSTNLTHPQSSTI